jgi:hypothetical protein
MKQIIISLLVFIPLLATSQQFESQDSIIVNKKNVHSLNWIDIDKDGQPNPIVQINDDSLGFIIVYDSVQGLSSDTLIMTGIKISF